MIQKIQNVEYLKRLEAMSLEERNSYLTKVGEWIEKKAPILKSRVGCEQATYMNILQLSGMMNDVECGIWEDGVRLLTALTARAETMLPDSLFSISAKRAVKRMIKVLQFEVIKKDELENHKFVKQMDADVKPVEQEFHKPEKSTGKNPVVKPTPVRPKHIDQYVHLLPEETQKRAAMVKGLLAELDQARENARTLAIAKEHSDKIAAWAKTATKLDDRIKAIYKELDDEWDKLVESGSVTVDDLGNAHFTKKTEDTKEKGKKPGRPVMTEEEKAMKKAEKDALKNSKRLEALKKYLRDTRTKPSPERQKQWKKNLKQLLALGGEITDSIRRAAEYYGIDIESKTENK